MLSINYFKMDKQKTFLEETSTGYVVDTLTIIKEEFGMIKFKSSAMRGTYLGFSKAKIKSIIKFLQEIVEE